MTRFVSPGGIEVTTPTVDGVQRFRVKDLGGIGGRTRTWLGDYFTEEALYARLAELGTDPARLEEVPSGFRPCPVHRDRGSRGAAGCLPWAVRCGRAYVLLGKRSRAGQDPGTWSCFGGAVAEGESTRAGRRARVPRGGARDYRQARHYELRRRVRRVRLAVHHVPGARRPGSRRAAGGTRRPGDRPGQVGPRRARPVPEPDSRFRRGLGESPPRCGGARRERDHEPDQDRHLKGGEEGRHIHRRHHHRDQPRTRGRSGAPNTPGSRECKKCRDGV